MRNIQPFEGASPHPSRVIHAVGERVNGWLTSTAVIIRYRGLAMDSIHCRIIEWWPKSCDIYTFRASRSSGAAAAASISFFFFCFLLLLCTANAERLIDRMRRAPSGPRAFGEFHLLSQRWSNRVRPIKKGRSYKALDCGFWPFDFVVPFFLSSAEKSPVIPPPTSTSCLLFTSITFSTVPFIR